MDGFYWLLFIIIITAFGSGFCFGRAFPRIVEVVKIEVVEVSPKKIP